MANVMVIRDFSAGDENVKSVYASSALQNGYAVGLGQKMGKKGAYIGINPIAEGLVALVYDARPVGVSVNGAKVYGLSHDPRNQVFDEGEIVDAILPTVGMEIAMTDVSGTVGGYVVYTAGSMAPKYANTLTNALLGFRVTGEGYVDIGNERVKTVEMICVKAN